MAGEPKRRHSKARKRTRRASISLESAGLSLCTNCKEPIVPHEICKNCGFYKGKAVKVKTEVKVVKA